MDWMDVSCMYVEEAHYPCEKERKKTCDDLNKAFMDSSAPSNHGE